MDKFYCMVTMLKASIVDMESAKRKFHREEDNNPFEADRTVLDAMEHVVAKRCERIAKKYKEIKNDETGSN